MPTFGPNARILSYPFPVIWGAFETTTLRMQQAGWELSAQNFDYDLTMALAFRHREYRMRAITNRVRVDRFRSLGFEPPRDLIFHITHMANDLQIVLHNPFESMNFEPIDAQPQYVQDFQPKSIDDFGIFATPLTRTQEIIVDPNDVQALFERIKTLQKPEQDAIRDRNRRRDLRAEMEGQPIQRQQFHAQILSIAA